MGSDLEGQKDLIIRIPQGWGNMDFGLKENKQNHVHTKTQRNGAATIQETEPTLPVSTGVSPVEVQVGRDSPNGWGTGSSYLGRSWLA